MVERAPLATGVVSWRRVVFVEVLTVSTHDLALWRPRWAWEDRLRPAPGHQAEHRWPVLGGAYRRERHA